MYAFVCFFFYGKCHSDMPMPMLCYIQIPDTTLPLATTFSRLLFVRKKNYTCHHHLNANGPKSSGPPNLMVNMEFFYFLFYDFVEINTRTKNLQKYTYAAVRNSGKGESPVQMAVRGHVKRRRSITVPLLSGGP